MTRENAQYIMSTAIESGIAYWMNEECSHIRVYRTEAEDDWWYTSVSFVYEGKDYHVSLEIMEETATEFSDKYPHLPINDDHDSISADAFFQYCAFRDIVFG